MPTRASTLPRRALQTWMTLAALCCAPLGMGACQKAETANPEDGASGEGESGSDPAGPTFNETLGERSQCRSGRIQVPDTKGSLRAVADDEHGFAVVLPDLADWSMACGDDPYFVAEAMGGAVSATVYAVLPNDELGEQEYLDLLAGQLESDIGEQAMSFVDRKLERTELGTWVLTFRIVASVDGVEKWQYNFITARQRADKSFVNLHMTVTAADDGSEQSQTQPFAEGLVAYLEMFRLMH